MTNTSNNYLRYLNLPKVPDEYLQDIPEIIKGTDELDKFTGTFIDPYQIYPVTERLKTWLLTNLPISNPSILHVHVISGTLPIHKDYARSYTLNYIIQTGGDDSTTYFYDDDLKVLASYKIEPFKWHDFNGQLYHTVMGATKDNLRIAITIGLDERISDEYSL